jgi:hypothetical protein
VQVGQVATSSVMAGLAVCLVAASVTIVGACSTAAAPHQPSIPRPVAAQVTSVLGEVQMTDHGVRSPLPAGAEVMPGDTVETGSGAAVTVGFHGASLHLGPSSSLYVVQAIRRAPGWLLQVAVEGSVAANVPNDARLIVYAGRATITAPAAAAFDATTGAGGQGVTMQIASGSVSVVGLGGEAVVRAGQSASVSAPTPDRPRPVPVVS